jgi:ubiquitin-like protein 4
MSDQAELAFVKKYVENIGAQPVNYNDDFQPPLEDYLKRVPTLPVSYTRRLCICIHSDDCTSR